MTSSVYIFHLQYFDATLPALTGSVELTLTHLLLTLTHLLRSAATIPHQSPTICMQECRKTHRRAVGCAFSNPNPWFSLADSINSESRLELYVLQLSAVKHCPKN